MKITNELIDHLATLSRLEFTDSEKESFKKDFSNIINYINLIEKVDVSDIELSKTKLNAKCDLREDEIKPSLSVDLVVKNAPKSMGGAVVVPTVVEEE